MYDEGFHSDDRLNERRQERFVVLVDVVFPDHHFDPRGDAAADKQ